MVLESWAKVLRPGPGRVADLGAGLAIAGGLVAVGFGPLLGAMAGGLFYASGIVLRPWLAIPAIVLTLPYHLRPRTFAGLELSVTEVAILLGAAAVAMRATLERRAAMGPTRRAVQMPAPTAVDWAVSAFLLAGLLSLLVTEYPKQSLRELRWLIVEPIVVFFMARATLGTPGERVAVLWSIAISGGAAALVGLGADTAAGGLTDPSTRAFAPYLSPNHLGLFLGRAGAVALAIALFWCPTHPPTDPLGRRLRPVAWGMVMLIGLGLLKTVSLGAWAGVSAALLTAAALRGRRPFTWVAAALVGLGLAALLLLPAERTIGRLDPATGTGLFRLHLWEASAQMVADHPLLGVGLDNFLYAYQGGYMPPAAWREPNLSHPHNWVLHFWLQLGLLGLGAALALLAWAAARAYRLFRSARSPADRVMAGAAAAALANFLVHGSLDNSYFLVDLAVLWWLLIALLVLHGVPDPTPQRSVE